MSVINESAQGVDTVLYDGSCPICSREVGALRRKCDGDERSNAHVRFTDIHQVDNLPDQKDVLLRDLHVYCASGEKKVGLDANIYMWQKSGFRWLPYFVTLPIVYFIARFFYRVWADRRFNSMYRKI